MKLENQKMSNEEQPLRTYAVDDDDMSQYLELAGVVNEKHPAQVGMPIIEKPIIQPQQKTVSPSIPQMKKPVTNTQEEIKVLQARQDLNELYLNTVDGGETIDESFIKKNFPTTNNNPDELKKYDVDESEMDIYSDMLNDGFSEMINPNGKRKKLIERLIEEREQEQEQEYEPEQLDYEDGEYEEQVEKITTAIRGNKPIKDISKLEDKIVDVESALKKIITKKYGSRNATIINKLLGKMITIIDTVDDEEILDYYSDNFSQIKDMFEANEINRNNFRKFVDFLDSFDYYLSDISSDDNRQLSDETIDLITVVSKLSEML
jgi:hypothetical protein